MAQRQARRGREDPGKELPELKPVLPELSPTGLFLDLPSRTVGEAKATADHWDDICHSVWKG